MHLKSTKIEYYLKGQLGMAVEKAACKKEVQCSSSASYKLRVELH